MRRAFRSHRLVVLTTAAVVVLLGVGAAVLAPSSREASATRSPVLGPGPVTVTVEIDHSRFTPGVVRVRPHTEVRFVIVNHDPIGHEFIVGGPEVHTRHADGHEAYHPPIAGEVSVRADAARVHHLRVPDARYGRVRLPPPRALPVRHARDRPGRPSPSRAREAGYRDFVTAAEIYYDPYDFDIDADPYPVWKRLRDEVPLYYNEQYDFYAVSRFDDVERCSVDWRTYISGKGSVLELIKAGIEIPPGSILFEDPPAHDIHRSLLSRVFTPRRIAEIEPKVRGFCAATLDPLVGSGGFDFIADLGAQMPMRTIGMLLGIPEADQEAIRDQIDEGLRLTEGSAPTPDASMSATSGDIFADYIDWRADHPSDDLMTDLLNAEFEDHTGETRKLTRQEILAYVGLLAAAGNETTTRLIGWTGKVLAEHPDQRALVAADRSLVPSAIEELLRYEAPSPVQARYIAQDVEHHGQTVAAGNVMVLLTAAGNRDERHFPDPDRFDVRREIDHHLSFGYGIHFCLGAALARLEGRVALDEVLQRFPTWEVDWDHAEQAHTSSVRGWERLPVSTG